MERLLARIAMVKMGDSLSEEMKGHTGPARGPVVSLGQYDKIWTYIEGTSPPPPPPPPSHALTITLLLDHLEHNLTQFSKPLCNDNDSVMLCYTMLCNKMPSMIYYAMSFYDML